jgi:uncharacterized membrane protein YbhN (UPF0104 family)
MNMLSSTTFRTAIAILFSILVYLVITWQLPIAQLNQLRYQDLLYALFASAAVYIMRSVRIRVLYPQIIWSAILVAVATQTFLLRILPMRLGELGLAVLLQKRGHLPLGEGMVLLVWLRLSEVCVLLIACMMAWYQQGYGSAIHLLWYLILALSILWIFLPSVKLCCRYLNHYLSTTLVLQEKKSIQKLQAICDHIVHTQSLSSVDWMRLALSSAIIMGLQCILFYFLLKACGVLVSWPAVIIGSSFAHIAGAIPAPTLGNIGTHESGWVIGFTLVGVSLPYATLTAIISQGFTFICAGLWLLSTTYFVSKSIIQKKM